MRLAFVLMIITIFSFFKPVETPGEFLISGTAQGTTYHIRYYASDSLVTKQQIDSILTCIDSSLSVYKPYSLITRFNQSSAGSAIDAHFVNVVKASLETYYSTGGTFDITVAPLTEAWGFAAKHIEYVPDTATIKSLLGCVGSDKIVLQKDSLIKKKPCIKVDVNGIAQGYSVDVVARFLLQQGIQNYLVEIGGEICVRGRKQPSGSLMKIGIESPGDDEMEPGIMQKIIATDNGAVTTSGNYRKYYESEGKKITHLIDPFTGYSIQNEMISATVYAKDAITADAYDNALMVMGLQKAIQFVEAKKDIAAYFIYRRNDGSVADTATTAFYKLFDKE